MDDQYWMHRIVFESRMERMLLQLKRLADEEEASQLQETKSLTLIGLKADAAGIFEGFCSTYGSVDLTGDMIAPGAFADSLREKRVYPLLWNHDPNQIVGVVEVQDDPRGLKVTGKLNLAVAKAKEVLALILQKAATGLSIGYDTIRHTWHGSVRVLQQIRLHEISVTPFPANPDAQIVSLKSHGRNRWEDGPRLGWAELEPGRRSS